MDRLKKSSIIKTLSGKNPLGKLNEGKKVQDFNNQMVVSKKDYTGIIFLLVTLHVIYNMLHVLKLICRKIVSTL